MLKACGNGQTIPYCTKVSAEASSSGGHDVATTGSEEPDVTPVGEDPLTEPGTGTDVAVGVAHRVGDLLGRLGGRCRGFGGGGSGTVGPLRAPGDAVGGFGERTEEAVPWLRESAEGEEASASPRLFG